MLKINIFYILVLSVLAVEIRADHKCYVCKADACKDELTSQSCAKKDDTCTTVFDASSNSISERGCTDEITAGACESKNNECFVCKSNNCNNAEKYSDYKTCMICDSTQDCVEGKDKNKGYCNKNCMIEMYPDSENKENYHLRRSCLDDKEVDEQEKCGTENKNCKPCSGDNCNKEVFPENRLSCFECRTEEDCKAPTSKFSLLYNAKDLCYAMYDVSKITQLGSRSSDPKLTDEEIEKLKKANKIYTCDKKDCNKLEDLPTSKSCALCNSKTDDNGLCAQEPNNVLTATKCAALGVTGCYTRILKDGSTERGCFSTLDTAEQSACKGELCEKCDNDKEENCNKKIFPENRKTCHSCTSEDSNSPKCATNNPSKPLPCKNYYDDKCASTITPSGITKRGCSKDITCDTATSKSCRTCQLNNCNIIDFKNIILDNNLGLWQDLPLTCNTCEGEDCKDETKWNVQKCTSTTDECITVFNADGIVIMRGCDTEVSNKQEEHCQKNPNLCYNCKSNKCNIATKQDEYIDCLYCGWINGESCAGKITTENPPEDKYKTRKCYKKCMNALYPRSDKPEDKTFDMIRTCADDMEKEKQDECDKPDSTRCSACAKGNCNNEVFPKDRRKCFHCEDKENCLTSTSHICQQYRDKDQCYYKYDDKLEMIGSGCVATLTPSDLAGLIKNNKIAFCSKDECNSVENQPKGDNKCIKCNSKDNVDCATNIAKVTFTSECAFPNNRCYNKINDDGTTERGCLKDLGMCEGDHCEDCGEEECNNQLYPESRRLCHICDSKVKGCDSDPKSSQVCPIYKEDQQCVSKYKNGKTERGCENEDLKCEANSKPKACQSCAENDCNKVNIKKMNGAKSVVGNFMMISLLSIALVAFSFKK